jgi:hypothetical protein
MRRESKILDSLMNMAGMYYILYIIEIYYFESYFLASLFTEPLKCV